MHSDINTRVEYVWYYVRDCAGGRGKYKGGVDQYFGAGVLYAGGQFDPLPLYEKRYHPWNAAKDIELRGL